MHNPFQDDASVLCPFNNNPHGSLEHVTRYARTLSGYTHQSFVPITFTPWWFYTSVGRRDSSVVLNLDIQGGYPMINLPRGYFSHESI